VVRSGILLGAIPIIIAGLLTMLLIRNRTKPITSLIQFAKQIAVGDLTAQHMSVKNKDEVGELALTLNTMYDNLKDIIVQLQSASNHLTQNAEDTSITLSQVSQALHQISGNIEEIASDTSSGAVNATEAANALSELAELIQSAKTKADASVENALAAMSAAEQGRVRVGEIT